MDFRETRKKHLMQSITRQYELLHEYETRRDLSDRPKEVQFATNEIKTIIQSLEDYIGQYEQICQDEGALCPSEVVLIRQDLAQLKQGQEQILTKQNETLTAIERLRYGISTKVERPYRILALALMSALNEVELRAVNSIIDEIDANQFSEQQISVNLANIRAGYEELLAKSEPSLGAIAGEKKTLSQVWNSPELNGVGKLKLSIPLIPTILSYDTELSFSIKQSLRNLWDRYFKGKQVLF